MRRNVINDRFSGWRLGLYQMLHPMSGYWRDPEHPWMLMKIYDGTWHTDPREFIKQPMVVRQIKEARDRGRYEA